MSTTDFGEPSVLLLGAGEVLSRSARLLGKQLSVVTYRSAEKCERARQGGWRAEPLTLPDRRQLTAILHRYPSLVTVVDSSPPPQPGTERPEDGALAVIAAVKGSAVRRVIYLSTTGVFGGTDGGWVDEGTPAQPHSGSSTARLAVEECYRSSNLEVAVARISALYGPGTGLGTSLRSGRYTLRGAPRRWSNRIHLEDAGRAIAALVRTAGPLPPLVCLADGCPAPIEEVVSFYCSHFGLPLPPRGPAPEQSWYAFERLNQRVSNRLLLSLLGGQLTFPTFREGAGTEFEQPFALG